MPINSRRRGYALSILLIALLVISIVFVAAIPLFSKKKDTYTNTSAYVKECVEGGDPDATSCTNSVTGLERGIDKDYESIMYYIYNSGSATYKEAALAVAKTACNSGTEKACNILLDRCVADSNDCNIADSDNDLYYYLTTTDSNAGKTYLADKGEEYYLQRMTTFNDDIKDICNSSINYMACDIATNQKTMTYNFNSFSLLRAEFDEIDSATGTNFHDGIVDLHQLTGGSSTWVMQYGGALNEYAYSMALSADGNYVYLAGETYSAPVDGLGGNSRPYLMKVRLSDGVIIWNKHWGYNSGVRAYGVAVSGTNVYVAGARPGPGTDISVIKFDDSAGTNPTVSWAKYYGGTGIDFGYNLAVSGNDIYVTGITQSDTAGDYDIFLMKLSDAASGDVVWKKHFGGADSDGHWDGYIEVITSGSYVYLAASEGSDDQVGWDSDLYITKLDSDGNSIWHKRYGGAEREGTPSLAVSGNDLYVSGRTQSASGNYDVFVMKLDDNGADNISGNADDGSITWKKYYGGAGTDYARAMIISGNYMYIAGYEDSDTEGSNDVLVMKLDLSTNGTMVFKNHYGGTGDETDADRHGIVLSGGYIYVYGYETSDADGGGYDVFLMKLNAGMNTSNITGWTVGASGDGAAIDNADWGTNGGDAMDMTASWTEDNSPIQTATTAADADWITGGGQVTGGTGVVYTIQTSGGDEWYGDTSTCRTGTCGTWTLEGTTINSELVDEWTESPASLTQNQNYFTTTDDNQITNIVGGVKSCTITATEPADTKIRILVSFDDRANWYKYSGGTWSSFSSNGALGANIPDGSTVAEIQTGLTNYTTHGTLDFAIWLQTDAGGTVTPSIDTVSVIYLREK